MNDNVLLEKKIETFKFCSSEGKFNFTFTDKTRVSLTRNEFTAVYNDNRINEDNKRTMRHFSYLFN